MQQSKSSLDFFLFLFFEWKYALLSPSDQFTSLSPRYNIRYGVIPILDMWVEFVVGLLQFSNLPKNQSFQITLRSETLAHS